jgi:predicted amidophosphoribosyltransferase
MDLLQKQIEPIKEKLDGNMCWGKINRNDYKKGLCPDCGTQLRMNGRCMFCECCGWSSCP